MIEIKKLLLIISLAAISVYCSDDNKDTDNTEPPIEKKYTPPAYADDYTPIAAWDKRDSWNLANVHDPSVEKCGDYYYMYGTDASYGNAHNGHGHFLTRRSKDLVNWEFRGMAMDTVPAWVKDTLNNMRTRVGLEPIHKPSFGYWAPVVRKVGNKYRMYYSIVVDNYIGNGKANTPANFDGSWTEHAFIGLMETDNLASNIWFDRGMVVCSSTDKGNNWARASLNDWNAYFKWNAIDPSFIVTPEGEHWLVYGSWHSGIVALKLNPESGKPNKLETLDDYGIRIARRQNRDSNRWQAQEAPEIIYNAETGYYYLFLAYDELSVGYNTRVCRSKNIAGPYLSIDGANITQGAECWPIVTHPYKFADHSGWVGISHCCIFQNPETKEWFYSSQGRLPANTNGNQYSNAIMMGQIRSVEWTEDGWPVVMPERYAAVPQTEITATDLIGTYENIFLKYQYQVQQASAPLTLSADMTVSGAISGSWSYDAAKKILTIGTYKVIVKRELNWEANPRVPTIVYSGLGDKMSVWGKKVN